MSRKTEPVYITEQGIFPCRLRGLMEEHQTKQKDLAAAIGMRPQTVSLYVQGQSAPDINCLNKIADYFQVTSDYLLGRTSDPSIDLDSRSVCDYTSLSPKAVDILHTLSNSPSYTRDLRISFINHILESDIFWNRIVEHLQSAYQLRKGYESELDPEQAEKLEESAAFIKALNFGGLTKYTIADGSFSSDMQIQFAADASKDLFQALIDDILKKEDNNGQH